ALVGSSLFVLRRKLPAAPRRYRAIGYPVVPAIFVLVAAWLVINSLSATPVESAAGLVLMAVGLPFFFFFRATRLDNPRDKDTAHWPPAADVATATKRRAQRGHRETAQGRKGRIFPPKSEAFLVL